METTRRSFLQLLAALPALGVAGSVFVEAPELGPQAELDAAFAPIFDGLADAPIIPRGMTCVRFGNGPWHTVNSINIERRETIEFTYLDSIDRQYMDNGPQDFSMELNGWVPLDAVDHEQQMVVRIRDGTEIEAKTYLLSTTYDVVYDPFAPFGHENERHVTRIEARAIGEPEFRFAS